MLYVLLETEFPHLQNGMIAAVSGVAESGNGTVCRELPARPPPHTNAKQGEMPSVLSSPHVITAAVSKLNNWNPLRVPSLPS